MQKWPLALKASPGGLGKIRPNKRLQDTQGGKEIKSSKVSRQEGRKQGTLEKWLQKEGKGSGDPLRTLETQEPALERKEPA